jgi:uncharacterized membrane protein
MVIIDAGILPFVIESMPIVECIRKLGQLFSATQALLFLWDIYTPT